MSLAERKLARALLEAHSDAELASQIVNDVPWIFGAGGDGAFAGWRKAVVDGSTIAANRVYIVGSAAVGFSLAPESPGRAFRLSGHPDGMSDIDVAIVDRTLFMRLWVTLVHFDRQHALRMSADARSRLREGVYWGFVGSGVVPRNTTESRTLRALTANARRTEPLRGHPNSIRVYCRESDLLQYQRNSISRLRQEVG